MKVLPIANFFLTEEVTSVIINANSSGSAGFKVSSKGCMKDIADLVWLNVNLPTLALYKQHVAILITWLTRNVSFRLRTFPPDSMFLFSQKNFLTRTKVRLYFKKRILASSWFLIKNLILSSRSGAATTT